MEEFVKTVTCGNHTQTYTSNFKKNIVDVGCGNSNIVHQFYPNSKVTSIDKKSGWNVLTNGIPAGKWDIIFANHVIEHLDDPDTFLEHCKKAMKSHTVLDIGTPNLCAWFNRILFLFGYLPHSYEVSYRKCYGRAFDWNDELTGGHIRVFSIPALVQLLIEHDFKIRSVEGEESYYPSNPIIKLIDKLLTKLSPTLASSFRVKCTI